MGDAVGRIEAVVIDCYDPAALARFWAAVFGVEPLVRDGTWANVSESGGRSVLAFQKVPEPKAGKNRLHLDVQVADISAATTRCVELGAKVRGDVITDDQGRFQVMADPEGNEFCLVN